MNNRNQYSPNFAAHTTQMSRLEQHGAAGFVAGMSDGIASGKSTLATGIRTLFGKFSIRKQVAARPAEV